MDLSTAEAIYYGSCFASGFFAGAFRLLRDREYESCIRTFSASASTGSVAFASVAILGGCYPDSVAEPWFGLGLSALLGAVSKEQDKILRAILGLAWNAVLKRFGLKAEDLRLPDETNQCSK